MESECSLKKTSEVHFTYRSDSDQTSLCQGDVLQPTEELRQILQEVHPYFLNSQYRYFMVLTQSCDLVRRGDKGCRTPYITLAAVREYSDFLRRELLHDRLAREVGGHLLVEKKKELQVYQLIERLYNNTLDEHFFLYQDEILGFPESMVVSLRVSIALKSPEHYEACLRAKRLELADEFKAKLGWLVGNMYSRVGTTDWSNRLTDQKRKEMLRNDLNSMCIIGSKEQLEQFSRELSSHQEQTYSHKQAMEYISGIEVKSRYDEVMDVIEEGIKNCGLSVSNEEKERLMRAIRSKKKLRSLIG